MALSASKLEAGIRDVWCPSSADQLPASAADAGRRLADAYADYYASAQAGGLAPTGISGFKGALRSQLEAACQAGSAAGFASQLVSAVVSFIGSVPYGALPANPPVGAPAAQAGLTPLFNEPRLEATQRISQVASLIDVMTKTTTVTVGTTPAPVT